jgi:hypothetical protein
MHERYSLGVVTRVTCGGELREARCELGRITPFDCRRERGERALENGC